MWQEPWVWGEPWVQREPWVWRDPYVRREPWVQWGPWVQRDLSLTAALKKGAPLSLPHPPTSASLSLIWICPRP